MLEDTLQQVVEQLCNQGCQQVNRYISNIEAGNYPANMQELSQTQRSLVLEELRSIMAVYERCDVSDDKPLQRKSDQFR